jgi:parvulin-like peptidyl-prolyl isomerase
MAEFINVSCEDVLYQLKINCQMSQLLEAVATRKVITDAIQKAGIKVDNQELQKTADNLRFANKLVKAEDTWAWLKKNHLTLEEFEQLAEINLLSAKLAHHLFADKIEPFFYEHQLDYFAAATYEVVLEDEDVAWEIFYALSEGEISFQDIARQHIKKTEICRAGGYRGIKLRSNFKAEIAPAVFAANPPQLLKPITTIKGVYLILVEEIIRPQLDDNLRLKIMADLFSNWLKEKISGIEVILHMESDSYIPTVQELLKLG